MCGNPAAEWEAPLTATLLLTRPRAASERFLAELIAAGLDLPAIVSPVIEIAPVPVATPDTGELIFTSENAVHASHATAGRAWVVGQRTAEAAQKAGLSVAHVAEDADGLVEHVKSQAWIGRVVHLRGEHASGAVAARLKAAGLDASERICYRQDEVPLTNAAHELLSGRSPVIVPLFSPRSAALLAGQIGPPAAPCRIVALSTAVAGAWPHESTIFVARKKTGPAMLEAVGRAMPPGRLVAPDPPR